MRCFIVEVRRWRRVEMEPRDRTIYDKLNLHDYSSEYLKTGNWLAMDWHARDVVRAVVPAWASERLVAVCAEDPDICNAEDWNMLILNRAVALRLRTLYAHGYAAMISVPGSDAEERIGIPPSAGVASDRDAGRRRGRPAVVSDAVAMAGRTCNG
ncbi:hypothetical protein BV25DRAFT_757331 [Artomyces pyxidatus]|uniref:Uncharacterized protein n=1 Tax=Artomyces pyxidatus TaxID=48021 RepID=A0ACB8SZV2_9AGAM|nr:hypothetical protein BV25DRAFT_757331 [Artomyces pyxidatus]